MSNAALLVELFTEELPPRALRALGEAFATTLGAELARGGLRAPESGVRAFATPRRLAAWMADVLPRAEDRVEVRKLMPSKVAFDEQGRPSAALRKRLEKEGIEVDAAPLERRLEGGVESVFVSKTIDGADLASALQEALDKALQSLPIPKMMSYQLADGETTVKFVRPAHGLVALHGASVIDVAALGLRSGRVTHGHRFQGVKDIEVANADAYEEALRAHGKVIASFDERRDEIRRQLEKSAAELGGLLEDAAALDPLLDEVTALVEWPRVYAAEFEPEFLAVPAECLILTMRQNQKYFPLFEAGGKLANRFLLVSNMDLADPHHVIEGNRRVVRPRLADARFFFETDKKTRLEDRVPQLRTVVYHNKLGTQFERMERVQRLAAAIARLQGNAPEPVARAALLAKADLVTLMVGEFPELQGVMGRYYALADGEDAQVANAIEQHYRPRFSGDALPKGSVATCLALADKLETLAGMFGTGNQPTGDKDPFALRRHALGVIRLLIEGGATLSLDKLLEEAFGVFPAGKLADSRAELRLFIVERLRGYLRETGHSANEIEAVLAQNTSQLDQVPRQLEAVRSFSGLPEAASLAAANKRVANILRQAETKGEAFGRLEREALDEPAERDLFDALRSAAGVAGPLFSRGDYTGYLKAFAVLRSPVDAFFDSIMVMAEDPALRGRRLALLRELREAMNRVADLSKLAA